MKKVLIFLLALLMCAGFVSAANPGYTLQLTTRVADGTSSGDGGVDDGEDFTFGGIKGWIFYSDKTNLVLGATSEANLNPVTGYDENSAGTAQLAADLDGNTAGADQVYLYIMTTTNCSENSSGTVKFESAGWKYSGTVADAPANIALEFESKADSDGSFQKGLAVDKTDTPYAAASGGTGATPASAEFTYTAEAGSNSQGVKSVTAKSTVTWPQDTNPLAGDWTADIKIYISATE